MLLIALAAAASAAPDLARWRAEAARVTITRDDWGIAHVHGKNDADAVFGAVYAQAEDDFPRIEQNYLVSLGRTAEADGPDAIWRDLRQRLWIDPAALQDQYAAAPPWLRGLMEAWADGLNYYLATHPETHPRVLTRFEPWMALSFTEGSIGGDIEKVDLSKLAAFYGGSATKVALAEEARRDAEPKGSNGIVIAPKLSASGHALLLINPHTSFFFRSELGMSSDAGLHAYGASTWGQFFLYQGWNEHLGWMHTSSGVDAVDEFRETIRGNPKMFFGGGPEATGFYKYGANWRPLVVRSISLRFRKPDGTLGTVSFSTYATHHGPIVRQADDGRGVISVALMNKPVPALEQSWLRTKATSVAAYMKVAALQANSSNNTLLASAEGTVAYLHPQFVPVRDNRFDYRFPVDGSDPATDWQGLTPLDKLPQVVNPASGWTYNSNDAPWRAAGVSSPRQADFPRYMDQVGASPRGDHATALLSGAHNLTLEDLRGIAFHPWLPLFAQIVPDLSRVPADPRLAGPVALLTGWDDRWSADSEPTTLANYWGLELLAAVAKVHKPGDNNFDLIRAMPPADKLAALGRAVDTMQAAWGGWRVPWSRVNCFQRLDAAITPHFDDAGPCTPVPFTSALWGSLASFGAKPYPNTRRWYGTSGNSFVAVVEFGPRVRAMAVTAGGESGHPSSPHFTDEAGRYATGALRPVYFYPDELAGHTERVYHPGT